MKSLIGYQALAFKNAHTLYISRLNCMYTYDLESDIISDFFNFKSDILTKISRYSTVLRRLLRRDVRYALRVDDDVLLVVRDKTIYYLNVVTAKIISSFPLPRGSRPLNVLSLTGLEGFQDGIYFGEYFSNPDKLPVKIYKCNLNGLEQVYEFAATKINHIHNIIPDYYRNCLWIFTGDFGDGAAIYQARDNFSTMEGIMVGSQNFRSCVGFTFAEGVVYATDSQYEQNSIRLLSYHDGAWHSDHIRDINGPSIHGTRVGNDLFFSTAVEPNALGSTFFKYFIATRGEGVLKNQSEIIRGGLNEGFHTYYENKKDGLPFILFQFGDITFPSGPNNTSSLVFTNQALQEYDFSTIIVKL